MGNIFMRKTEDVFIAAKDIIKKIILKKNVDFSVLIFMEKLQVKNGYRALSRWFYNCVVGTHTYTYGRY